MARETREQRAARDAKNKEIADKLKGGLAARGNELAALGRAANGMGVSRTEQREAQTKLQGMGKVGKQVIEDVAVAAGAKPKRSGLFSW